VKKDGDDKTVVIPPKQTKRAKGTVGEGSRRSSSPVSKRQYQTGPAGQVGHKLERGQEKVFSYCITT
jgi:hypothetical protein